MRTRRSQLSGLAITTLCGLAASLPLSSPVPCWASSPKASAASSDSCVDCHRNPDFIVTRPKLYEYFRDWQDSVHRLSDVTCSDCHGGNPDIADEKGAHGGEVGEADADSAVNFANVPETCGGCHEEVHDAFVESRHFKHLVDAEDKKQGPNCVTCHGSMNTHTLNVNTVEDVCSNCHTEARDNHPEVPDEARDALNKMLSMDRLYRYIARRMDPAAAAPFLRQMDERMHGISVSWHTFDLEALSEQSEATLKILKQKRREVARKSKSKPKPKPKQERQEMDESDRASP